MFTITPVPSRWVPQADRATAALALRWLPLVGASTGAVAGGVGLLVRPGHGATLLAAALALAASALLTRGLHLDGLADVADGLGSRRPAEQALAIMKQSDIGPFGVATLVIVLLIQAAALAQGYASVGAEVLIVLSAVFAAGRFVALMAAAPGVPNARRGGFGAVVAASATTASRWLIGAATLLFAGLAGWALGPAHDGLLVGSLIAGNCAAYVLRRHCVRRFGGVTGDVFGALIETATTVSLVIFAAGCGWMA